jgi:predicted dehydrogenase
MNRREFIGQAATVVAAVTTLTACHRGGSQLAPSDRVRLGIIGAGSRGQELMRVLLRVPGVQFTGLCDIYEPRFAQGRKITGEGTPVYRDYRQLLDAREVDAVVVATPLSLHAEHVTASLDSGRHVYGEKSMALTVAGCNAIVSAVKRSGRHYQIGLQYQYAPEYQEALRIIRSGKLGRVLQIHAHWHRNNSWRRAVPDPKDTQLEQLINWRLYRKYSGGLLAELASHHIAFANDVFGSLPQSVIGSGGIDYWTDGREVPDNVQVTYRYPGGQTLFFSAITTNRLEGCQIRVFATGGSIVLTQDSGTLYYEPSTAQSAVPQESIVDHGIITGASYKAEEPYKGKGKKLDVPSDTAGNAEYLACSSFIDCLRQNRHPQADENVAWKTGVSVALANQAIDGGNRVIFPRA